MTITLFRFVGAPHSEASMTNGFSNVYFGWAVAMALSSSAIFFSSINPSTNCKFVLLGFDGELVSFAFDPCFSDVVVEFV